MQRENELRRVEEAEKAKQKAQEKGADEKSACLAEGDDAKARPGVPKEGEDP
jgi:hypothetical protein